MGGEVALGGGAGWAAVRAPAAAAPGRGLVPAPMPAFPPLPAFRRAKLSAEQRESVDALLTAMAPVFDLAAEVAAARDLGTEPAQQQLEDL